MLRRLVWYPDGSPAGAVALGLPDEFEARALSELESLARPRRRSRRWSWISTTTPPPPPGPHRSAAARRRGARRRRGRVGRLAQHLLRLPDQARHAVRARAHALDNAFEHAALLREAEPREAARGAERDRRQPVRGAGHRRAPGHDPGQGARDHPQRRRVDLPRPGGSRPASAPLQADPERLRHVPFREFTIPSARRARPAMSPSRRDPAPGRRLRAAPGRALPHQPVVRPAGRLPHQVDAGGPMRTPAGETIGVLQLINCKRTSRRGSPRPTPSSGRRSPTPSAS